MAETRWTHCRKGWRVTDDDRNIVLTGFMGTGKSVVGQVVAERLGRPFVDMDARIAERAGQPIPDIFRQRGEAAFRQQERDLCAELALQRGLVIATGGGALVDEANRALFDAGSLVICLDCEPAELSRRLSDAESRPMLWSADPEARLRDLLAARQPAYARIPWHMDTTGRTPEEVAADVLALYSERPGHWRVRAPTHDYVVHMLPGGLARVGPFLRAHGRGPLIAIVSDANVWPLHGETFSAGLRRAGLDPRPIVLPAGEEHKNLHTLEALYDRLASEGLDRGGALVALGGGVVTDLAGLAAATYMRGVPLVPIPTTLLGMVDAAIGGKVAVDHPRGKNLIGAFVEPLLVMLDPGVLATLPVTERLAGLAEIIKAGIIADPALFGALEGPGEPDTRWLVERAVQVKIAIVEEDPREEGRRAVLNLGHTFAHAFELLSGYRLGHGLAVSTGMAAAAHLAEVRGVCSAGTRQRIVAALSHRGLPTTYSSFPPDAVYEAMASDKKRRASRLQFVLPRDIGDVVLDGTVSRDDVLEALRRIQP